MEDAIEKTKVLMEALPYIKAFRGKTVLIKYGGSAMVDDNLKVNIIQDIIFMQYVGMNPIIVHGGGYKINEVMRELGKEPAFVKGMRVTDKETAEIVESVLEEKINSELVGLINEHGGNAVGLSGKDESLIMATRHIPESGEDVGFVGDVESINPGILSALKKKGIIPVIAPVGIGSDGHTYNINADTAAGEIAAILKVNKLVILTDVRGILRDQKNDGMLLSTIRIDEVQGLMEEAIISSGMIPKVNACIRALRAGVAKTHIIDGRILHSLLLEIYTDKGIGTEIIK
jgi:acetylglutamate kinase